MVVLGQYLPEAICGDLDDLAGLRHRRFVNLRFAFDAILLHSCWDENRGSSLQSQRFIALQVSHRSFAPYADHDFHTAILGAIIGSANIDCNH